MSMSDAELEVKATSIAENLKRDLGELGMGDLEIHLRVEPSPDGPRILISQNGTEEDGEVVNQLFLTLLREEQWPGI